MTFPAHSISQLRLSPLVIHSNFSTLFPSMDQYKKLGPQPSPSFSKSGSCNMAKWAFASSMGSRNNGCLVGVRCEALADDHGFYMRRCVELARKAVGCTSPNPMVGCVIVKDGKIVGEGFHPKAGQPHAEVFALRDAGDLAENGTAYVSLEPCNHYGRTPPCTEALIKAKVKKVVVGMVDPNPIVASKGVARLRDAGINVLVGVEEQLCRKLNEAFICRMLTGMPFLTMRYSLSVNGRLLDQLGEGAAESGGYHSQLLQEYDAVILSSTSLANNHLLPASKEPGANRPLNIIVGKSHTLPTQIPIYTSDAASKAIIFTDMETVVEPKAVQKGIETVILSDLNISTILEHCKDQGLCSVLLDIRGSCGEFEDLIRGCLEQHLVQKVVVEVLPIWNGGKQELLDTTFKNLGQTNRLKNLTSRVSGGSVLLEGYL